MKCSRSYFGRSPVCLRKLRSQFYMFAFGIVQAVSQLSAWQVEYVCQFAEHAVAEQLNVFSWERVVAWDASYKHLPQVSHCRSITRQLQPVVTVYCSLYRLSVHSSPDMHRSGISPTKGHIVHGWGLCECDWSQLRNQWTYEHVDFSPTVFKRYISYSFSNVGIYHTYIPYIYQLCSVHMYMDN